MIALTPDPLDSDIGKALFRTRISKKAKTEINKSRKLSWMVEVERARCHFEDTAEFSWSGKRP